MIQAITPLDRGEASAVLAQAARLVLGLRGTELSEVAGPRDGEQLPGKVVNEIQKRVASRARDAEDLVLRVKEELSREMSDLALDGADLNEIRQRVGQRGTLPTSMYEIVLTRYFKQNLPLFSVKSAHVRSAILHANAYEHLNPKTLPKALTVSIFLHTPRVGGRP